MQRAQTAAARTGARERGSALNAEQREQQRAWQNAAKEAEKAEKQKVRIRENSVNIASRLAMKQADAEIKAAEKSARETTRAAENAERDKTRAVERESKARARAAATQAAEERRVSSSFKRDALGRVGGTLRTAGGLAMGALTFGGAVAATDAIRDRASLDAESRATAIKAYIPGQNQRVDPKEITQQALAVQAATNIDAGEVAQGLGRYVDLASDYKGGSANLMGLGKLAKASGSNFGEVMSAAGYLKTQNPDITDPQMMEMMRGIVGQGKLGAIGIAELAKSAPKLTASSAMYSGSQGDAQRNLLGLAQVAVKTTGSPEDAATAITHLGSDIMGHRKELAAAGVTGITDKNGMLADPAILLSKLLAKAGGDPGKLKDLGIGDRSIKVFEALAPMYQRSEAAKKGSGEAAVRNEVNRYEKAGYSEGDVNEDFNIVMKGTAERFKGSVQSIEKALADGLQPSVDRIVERLPELVPQIVRLAEAMGKLAGIMVDSPLLTLGAVITGAILKDIAAAKLTSVITQTINGGAGGYSRGAGVGGGIGVGGNLVAGLAIVATAVTITAAGVELIDQGIAKQNAKDDKGAVAGADATGLAARLAAPGGASPATVAAAQAEVQRLQGAISEEKGSVGGGVLDKLADFFGSRAGNRNELGKAADEAQAAREKILADNTASMKALTAAIANVKSNPADPARNVGMAHPTRGGTT